MPARNVARIASLSPNLELARIPLCGTDCLASNFKSYLFLLSLGNTKRCSARREGCESETEAAAAAPTDRRPQHTLWSLLTPMLLLLHSLFFGVAFRLWLHTEREMGSGDKRTTNERAFHFGEIFDTCTESWRRGRPVDRWHVG